MNETTKSVCPKCGAALPANAPAGLCPRCLMAMNLATQTVLPEEQAGASGAPASPPPAPAEIAPHFPQFDILECLGRGGMGVVYKARQKSLNRLVALKLLAPERVGDPQFDERFTREAQALAALNHPNIVTIHDFGQAGGFYYLLMEFVDGMNLRHLLQVERISAREALAIVPQICDALQYAHDQGIVHRDIKPENILLDRQGRVKVADFGLAKLVGTDAGGIPLTPSLSPNGGEGVSALTDAGKVMGTPQYMAPEQREHPTEVDHRADIYSLGVVFYQMLTGELPGKPIEAPSRKVHIDVRLDEVVLRALEREPERRYQQVSQVRTAVETISMDIEKSKGGSQDPASPNSTANTSSEALAQELQVSDYVLDIGSCLRRGWALVRGDFWPAVGVTTLILLLLHVGGFLFSGPLLGGLGLYFLKRIRGEQSSLETSFSGFRLAFMPLFLAGLIGVLVTSVGLVCLVLPGAFLAGVTILTLVLVIDKGLDFWPAFKLSGAAISRHWGKFFGFMLVLALINVAGIVAGVVGLLITFPISLAAAIFAYEDIFASAAWVASPQPADWKTWSSSQSQQVREICFHLTEAERREWTLRGLLFGIWNAATFFAPLGIALFASKPLNWIFAVAVLLVGLAFYPLWRRMTREFLASTSWAKQQGIAPESLWMSPHTVLVGRRGDKAVIHWRGVLLRFVMALVLLILLLVAVGAISASRSGVLAGWIDSRSMGVAFMSAAIFTWILLRHGLSTPVEQLPTLDGPGRTGPRAIESEQKRPGRKVALGLLAAAVGLGTLGAWMFLPEGTNLTGQAKIAVVAMLFTTIFGGVLAALANRGKAAPKPAGPSHLSRTAVVALVLSVGGCMLSLLIGLVIVQSWEWVYGSFFAIETAALILGILAWDRRTGKAAVILSFALMLAWIPATLTHMAQVAPDRLPKESPRIASAESPNRVLEVRCEGRKASIRAELDDLHELRLFIGSDAVGWSSWHAGWTSVTATVEASDHIKLEDGSMGRGLIFQVQGTRHNIATTPEDPVPGEVVLRPDSMITQEDGTFTFADIRKTNGTLVPVSIRVRPVSGKPPGIQSLGPVVERVVVGADQATLEGQGRPGFSLLLSLGDTTNRWECRFPYDTRFTAMFKRATRHGFSWTVSDRAGKALFATTVPQFEGEDFKQGVIVFREGTLAPEPDGSLVIAWLELGNGGLIPMSVRLEKDGKSAGMSSFSPVIERIVQEGIREKSALDLDTGEIIDGPGVLVSPKQLETWMFDSGMDLLGVVSSGAHGLTGFEMVVMPVEREHWDMPAAKVQEVLATKAPLTRAAMTRLGGLPATYLFKTRERGMGVLQIVDFTNNPSAVKIRYKLVQATGSTSAGPPQTNASRTFPLRHILASEMTDDLRQILLGKPAMEARPAPDNLQLAVTNALLRTRWSLGPTEPLVGQLNIAPEQLRQLQAISPATDIPIESVDRQELSALFNDYLSATDKPAAEKALVEAIVALDAKYSDRTMELVDTAPQVRQIFTEEQWAGPSRRFGN